MGDLIVGVRPLLTHDRRLRIIQLEWLMVTEMCNPVSCDVVHRIIKNKLAMWKVSVWWVLHQLSYEHMRQRMVAVIKFLTPYNCEGEARIRPIVTGDEISIYHYTPLTKWQSMVWKQSDELMSSNKIMFIVFWDWKDTLYEEYLIYKKGGGATQHHYFDTILRWFPTIVLAALLCVVKFLICAAKF